MSAIERVIIAHNPVAGTSDASTRDVLAQVELVARALTGLGIEWSVLAATRRSLCRRLVPHPGTLVFNLVEAPPGDPAVHPATAAVLELLRVPFTGSSAATLWLTTDKITTRAVLAAEGLPIAPGCALDPNAERAAGLALLGQVPGPWILKPACEDASLGLEGACVMNDPAALLARVDELATRFPGQRQIVEQYLPGRELNVSLLASEDGLVPLPVAEIVFEEWPEDLPRLVSYEAKWEPESFAYQHTIRRFPNSAADGPLSARASALATAAAKACGVTGYGRVDLRIDVDGELRILEVNANPCLAADAGFMAAAGCAGLTEEQVVDRLLAAALADHARRSGASYAAQRLSARPSRASSWQAPASPSPAPRARSLSLRRSSRP